MLPCINYVLLLYLAMYSGKLSSYIWKLIQSQYQYILKLFIHMSLYCRCKTVNVYFQVMTLTNEGGRLKRDMMLVDGKDFKLVPDPVWKALSTWYGGTPALPRTVSQSL